MEKFTIQLPLTSEYLTTVRLTTGGICALAGFDVDSTEDYKVCVTESLLILKRNGFQLATVVFTVGESLNAEITGDLWQETQSESLEDEISRALLSALIGEVQFVKADNGKIQKIVFEG